VLRYIPAVLIGRFVRVIARMRKPGGGAAIPGVVVNKIAPNFLPQVLNGFAGGVVVVTGTAGKSTTTRIVAAIVQAHGRRVFTNPSTANIAQGLTSAIIAGSSVSGRIDADIAILEMDEGHAAKLSARVRPRVAILLNVCIDQVDRFFDPAIVTTMLRKVAANTTQAVVINRDDASVVEAAHGVQAQQIEFGMQEALFEREGEHLGYVVPRHRDSVLAEPAVTLESVSGRSAVIAIDGKSHSVQLPSTGLHYGVDAAAALAAARTILGADFDAAVAVEVVNRVDPVFGRGEVVTVAGQRVECILIQNPTSLRLNTRALDPATEQLMFAVGSDVRDYSYLWAAALDGMPTVTIAAGPKALDVALHCLYSGVAVEAVETDLTVALDRFLALPAPKQGHKTIVFSADSMRRTRRHWHLPEQDVA
jgi:UDP-N-acetylmuramyl tripeptide synthase